MPVERSVASEERRTEILKLRHHDRWSFRMIADHLELSVSYVHGEYTKAAQAFIPVEEVAAERRAALDGYDMLRQKVLEVMGRDHVVAQFGKVVKDPDTGQPYLDDGPILQAALAWVRIEARVAKIVGYEAPSKSTINVVTEGLVEAEIAKLERELAEAAGDEGVPESIRP